MLNITAGQADSTWTTSDFTTVEGKFDTYFTNSLGVVPNWLTITEYKWYVKEFAPLGSDKPYVDHGPPVRLVTKSFVGGGSTQACAQQSLTLTEKTAWARHWGRVYFPFVSSTGAQNGGRITSGMSVTMATNYSTLLSDLAAADFQMVVPVTQIDKAPARDLLTVSSIQVDDILDVLRSRRPRNPLVRTIKP